MKYSLRSLMIAGVGVGLLLTVIWGGYCFLREQGEMIHDAYCIDWASDMIIQFMDDNDGRYPRSWSDLRQPYEKLGGLDHGFPFDEIQSRVEVDFTADLLEKSRGVQKPFIRLKSGRKVTWGTTVPNERIQARITGGKQSTP